MEFRRIDDINQGFGDQELHILTMLQFITNLPDLKTGWNESRKRNEIEMEEKSKNKKRPTMK